MLINMNIKMVLETGMPAPKCMILLSAKVKSPTTTIISTMVMPSRLRLLRSSSEIYDTGLLNLFFIMFIGKDEL
jgi:hypothetical protein